MPIRRFPTGSRAPAAYHSPNRDPGPTVRCGAVRVGTAGWRDKPARPRSENPAFGILIGRHIRPPCIPDRQHTRFPRFRVSADVPSGCFWTVTDVSRSNRIDAVRAARISMTGQGNCGRLRAPLRLSAFFSA